MNHIINDLLTGLNHVGKAFCGYSASVFVQSAILVVAIFIIDLLLRKRVRAIFRYCLWLLVLVKLILPPTLSLPTGIGYWGADQLPAVSSGAFDVVGLEGMGGSAKTPHAASFEDPVEYVPSVTPATSRPAPITWQAVLFVLWLVGVLAFLVVLAQRLRFVRGLVAASRPAEGESVDLLRQCRRQLGLRRNTELRLSETLCSPAVCGLFKTTILIPANLVERLSPEGLRATLIHELAHVKRRDLWVNLAQTVLQVVYFYNPFVWFANSVIRKVCEEAVDESVLVTLGGKARDYSNTLIDIGEMVLWKADLGLRLIGVAESKKALQWRIKHMLTRPIPKSSKLGVLGVVALLVVAAVLLPMARAERPDQDKPPVAVASEAEPAQSLYQAAVDGNVERVKQLIAEGADVNADGIGGWTPLLGAVNKGHVQVVKVLLENGADANVEDSGYTPLFYAIWNDETEMARSLVSGGADVNKRPDKDDPPLFYAVWQCHAVVKTLIDRGADVNAEGVGNGWTPLRHALHWGYADVAKEFVGTGVNIPVFHNAVLEGNMTKVRQIVGGGTDVDTRDKFGWTPTYWALSAGHKEIAEYLLDKGADVTARTEDGCTLLHQASKAGFADITGQLIAKGADVNAATTETGRQPLADAAGYGHEEIVKLLIAKGADVNAMFSKGRHPLGEAASAGHENVVKLLLASGAEVNLHSESSGGALHAAARFGHAAILDLLIANGADVNLNAVRGTPLHRAVFGLAKVRDDTTNAEIVQKLLAKGADVNAKDPQHGRTPLHVAVDRGRYKTAEVLIAAGADVNATDKEGKTPLSLAKEEDRTQIVELLRKHGAKEDSPPASSTGKLPKSLHHAVADGDIEQVKLLIAGGADVNAKDKRGNAPAGPGQTPLLHAASGGHEEIARLLIAAGADVNMSMAGQSWTPLLDAANAGHAQVVKVLLENGAKVDLADEYGYTPLFYALWAQDEESVKALISAGADTNKRPSQNDCPPLFYVVWENYQEGVRILIDAGADVNAEDENGWTPLHFAVKEAQADVAKQFIGTGVKIPAFQNAILEGNLVKVKQFIESGVDVDTRDKFGCTPAYWALSVGQREIAGYLLDQGADIKAKTKQGRTLLHQASTAGFVEIVKSLIAKGVEVDARPDSGDTPLKIAAGAGHKEIVRLLIANGAEINVTAKNGMHPLGDATVAGHEEVVKLLLANGARVNLQPQDKMLCGTALHAAARGGHIAILDLLIANGADVNAVYKGGTPLHLAVVCRPSVKEEKSLEIVEKLLAHEASVNAKSPSRGRTPLHEAANRGRYKLAECLVVAGADVSATDKEGHAPLWYAKRKDRAEIVELLRRHGAK